MGGRKKGKYVKKTDYKDTSDEDILAMLKAIKIDKNSALSIARQYDVPKSNVYRLLDAFEDKYPKGEEITEEKLNDFISTRKHKGVKTVSQH